MDKKQLGETLRNLREKSGYTQGQIANILKVDRSTYTYYELGKTLPDIFTILALSHIFQLSVEKLLNCNPQNVKSQERSNNSAMFYLSKAERELILYYRSMPLDNQQQFLDSISSGF